MPKPFAPAGTRTHYAPDRPVALEHVRLELDLDLPGKRLAGRSRLTLRVRRDDLRAVELHAVDMEIEEVLVDSKPAEGFAYDGENLRVELGRPRERGARVTVQV